MPQLRIERVAIRDLQVGGFDHLHLVLEPDRIENSTHPQDEWLGIEGSFHGLTNAAVLSTLGGNGEDIMTGGEGDDSYVVDNANDVVLEAANGGIDKISLRVSFILPDHVENLTLLEPQTATAAQSLIQTTAANPTTLDGTGNVLRNTLVGTSAANTLSGLDGDDVLFGALGNDVLIGGNGRDTITDFSVDGRNWWWWFEPQHDALALDITGVESIEDVIAHATQANNNVVLDFGNGDQLTLQNMRLSQLDDAEFQFV